MSLNELFLAGAKPKRITRLTSAAPVGTYVPTEDNARCLVRIQAGGAGGYTSSQAGGAGAMVEVYIRVPIAGLPYVVGAGGAVATNGSVSKFGPFVAAAGSFGNTSASGSGGSVGVLVGGVDADGATILQSGLSGVSGGFGAGGVSVAGGFPGYPVDPTYVPSFAAGTPSTVFPGGVLPRNAQGNGSGGNSFYGLGGASGASPSATDYGAGGGINAAGQAGCIEIWDFGA